jgi:protein ImuB
MRLWIGLYLPQLPLEVFSPRWSADPGIAILDQERVLACSAQARAAGVQSGMRRGGALMLLPEVRLHERAPAREAEALQAVAMALLQYTPLVAQAEEATLLMDVGASLRLFGGIRALCRRIHGDLRALGFTAALSCAPTARGAWLLARQGRGRVLSMAALTRRLDRARAELLVPARPFGLWFEGIGCYTLGDLRRLPRAGLQRRCGGALLDWLDAAYGLAPELFDWIETPVTFKARLELFDRIEQADLLLAGAQRLLVQMMGWLCARQLAVERVVLLLEHERGRVARPPTRLELTLAEPTWRDEHLVRLLKERLGQLQLEAPVIGLVLEALQLQAMEPPSESLFPDAGGSEEDQFRLFELLAARLGAEQVLQAAPQADYRPELANRWVPVQRPGHGGDLQAQLPPDVHSLPRPAWLLAKPVALLMRQHRPFYGSPLKMVSTPERIEAGWWSQPQTRDYFIAQGQDHAYYWVYRERIVGAGEEGEPRWFLHGLFG